jgi:hypothetical protein
MKEYTIKIEGLPEGYEPGKATYVEGLLDHCIMVQLRRKVRKYDHSKTLDDVPVELVGRTGIFTLKIIADGYGDLEAETAALKEENERLRWQLCKSETDI